MLFNSLDFAVFLPLVFLLYWFVTNRNLKVQNLLIVVASYVFYGWWDWRFLSLIIFSTGLDYLIGRQLNGTDDERKRKLLMAASVVVNLGFLGFFKYYDFFLDNFTTAFTFLGMPFDGWSLNIILPVGISFYTFQTLSYTIDVYRRKLEPTKDFLAFAAFVCFFPQLVAGPIERATNLLPQFHRERHFEYAKAVDGLRQILWGFFKKIMIADTLAPFVNDIFANSANESGSSLLLGAVFFSLQIYGDFSGYSDIAIGTSRLFGFDLKQNFAFPYFSRDIAEFWRRWHISLSTWFRDYLYVPLGGSRAGKYVTIRNVFIIFLVSGFWHGANWTFIIWGLIHALLYLPSLLFGNNRKYLGDVAAGKWFPSLRELASMLGTFSVVALAWVFFRAESVTHAVNYLLGMADVSLFAKPSIPLGMLNLLKLVMVPALFLVIEWNGRDGKHALEKQFLNYPKVIRLGIYFGLALLTLFFSGSGQTFIYFQF